jgi:hypothetical protein
MATPAPERGVRRLPPRGTDPTDTRLEELSYQQGRRDADVDMRLLSHERRLNRINGSIEKHAESVDELRHTMDGRCDSIEEKIDEVIAAQHARDAVEADREQQGERAAQRIFSRRTLLIGFWTVAVMLLAVIVSVLALVLTVA